jgi:hypothetical protein
MAKVQRRRGNHDAFGTRSWVQMIETVLDSRESIVKTRGSGPRSILEALPRAHPLRTAPFPTLCLPLGRPNHPVNVHEAEPLTRYPGPRGDRPVDRMGNVVSGRGKVQVDLRTGKVPYCADETVSRTLILA